MSATPRLSVLIPNFNNGLASSRDGRTDLITDLLQSLHDTLHDDPTPVEIIACDDGSTDDSLDTLRTWAAKTWRGGEPFLQLIEAPHCGVLAKTANTMVARSRGEFLARLDGDTFMLTRHWASKLCRVFDEGPPRLGVVGPKQLRPDLTIHAYGDWLLHPKGYHHVAAGCERYAVTRPLEVDHVMGCFYCCRRAVHDQIGGYDEAILRGQTIDFGLRARLKGWSCIAVPHIEYIHRHGLRKIRATRADTADGVRHTLDTFRRKWGFDRIAPDLDVVRRRYAGTPLLWNARVFAMPNDEADERPAVKIEESEWARYATDTALRQRIDFRVALTKQIVQQTAPPKRAAVVGCNAGLVVHLLAMQGLTCVGTDRDAGKIELARQCLNNRSYTAGPPRYEHQTDPHRLPLDDGEVDMVALFEQLERHPNPVALLREVGRVLATGGLLIVSAARPTSPLATGLGVEGRYQLHELFGQLHAVGGWHIVSNPDKDSPHQPLIVVAKRTEAPVAPLPEVVEEVAALTAV